MHAETDAAVEIVRTAARLDWTWTVPELADFCRAMGWHVSERRPKGATLATGLDISRPEALVYLNDGDIREISVWVSDIAEADDESAGSILVDGFVEIEARLVEDFGPPSRTSYDREPKSGWDFPRAVVFLASTPKALRINIVSRETQALKDVPEHAPRFWEF
ncbi:DUF6301 family protein [Nocardia sp. NBC_01503]|uniref:DUF6301 family protein n=1 Tax=Nocardia sp. NBC_01503 TaxID=2975997 RepID=UPI002E7AB788|nr:DUF6301 family protein [Nocardia sp. NBC_01503]WTL35620.1 DUF6301 family protein [Nocardia sp. NBC_01503]